jgi:hypothetical protein
LAAAAVTRRRDSSLTRGDSRMTSETRARDTPAAWATSSNVGALLRLAIDMRGKIHHSFGP